MINIGKGVALKLLILGLPQLRAQSLTGQRRKPGASHAQHQRDQCTGHHLQSLHIDISPVAARHTHVDEVGHDKRNQKLKDALCHNADHRQSSVFFVLLHIRK